MAAVADAKTRISAETEMRVFGFFSGQGDDEHRPAVLSAGRYTGASVLASCRISRKTDRYITRMNATNTRVDWLVPLMQQVS